MRYPMLLAATALALVPALAPASETVTYNYDARGRLVQVAHSGMVNSGVSSSYAYDKADNRTSLTIAGAGGTPTFSISDASVAEGGTLSFTVMRNGSAAGSDSVNYATANGTATAGTDYTAKSGTLTFATTETSKTVAVVTLADSVADSGETLLLNLSGATAGATIGDGQGVGTISSPPNLPPVTQPDSVQVGCNVTKTVNVTANDSDPEGNTPLTVTQVSVDPGDSFASVASASSITVTGANDNETATATYTVKDSLNATSTGTLTISVVGGPSICGDFNLTPPPSEDVPAEGEEQTSPAATEEAILPAPPPDENAAPQ